MKCQPGESERQKTVKPVVRPSRRTTKNFVACSSGDIRTLIGMQQREAAQGLALINLVPVPAVTHRDGERPKKVLVHDEAGRCDVGGWGGGGDRNLAFFLFFRWRFCLGKKVHERMDTMVGVYTSLLWHRCQRARSRSHLVAETKYLGLMNEVVDCRGLCKS